MFSVNVSSLIKTTRWLFTETKSMNKNLRWMCMRRKIWMWFIFLFPNRAHNFASLSQMGWLGFSFIYNRSYTATGIQTHVSRVAPDWDLSDALPTELHGRGLKKSWRPSDKENSMRLTLLAFSLLRMRPRSMLPMLQFELVYKEVK